MKRRGLWIVGGIVLAAVVGLGAEQVFLWWGTRSPTDEAERLAVLSGVRPGSVVAEIGAGRGEMARVMASKVLPDGHVFVTELSDARLEDLRALAAEPQSTHIEVRRGDLTGTSLPDACCDVIYMRHVFHHFDDTAAMTAALRRAVVPGGRLAIIDFAPQWALGLIAPIAGGRGHGTTADEVIRLGTAAGFQVQHHEPRWTSSSFLVSFEAR